MLPLQSQNGMNMLKERIEEVMQKKGITKAEFARRWGCLPQNVNNLLNTDNLKKLTKIAEVIGCDVTDFMTSQPQKPQPVINGYIEFDGVVYPIKSMSDFTKLHDFIKQAKRQNK